MRTHRNQREKGSYIVLAAFVLIVLMMTAALAVDISRKYQLEQTCQDVADAAALAGAAMLPNAELARTTCTTYIRQAAGNTWYTPRDSDVLIAVAKDNRSGTVGVLVRGSWDPLIMPDWLVGGILPNEVVRYSIAVMALDTSRQTWAGPGDLDSSPNGPYALFVGDTAIISSVLGNSLFLIGNAHFNDIVNISTHIQNMQIDGTFEVAPGSTGGGGITPVVSGWEEFPALDRSELVWDVVLDENDAVQKAYYNTAKPLLASNGVAVPNTTAEWDGTKWIIESTGNVTSDLAGQAGAWGTGVDLNIIGAAEIDLPGSSGGGSQNYWLGSISSTKLMELTSNNAEIRTVNKATGIEGLDNIGLALSPGWTMGPGQLAFDNGGNALNVYGLMHTWGNVTWTGNMNNYNAGYEGTGGNYDAVGNGFIKGSLVAGSLTSTGNNFKVYYDGDLSGDAPITNAQSASPDQFGTPTVWLQS